MAKPLDNTEALRRFADRKEAELIADLDKAMKAIVSGPGALKTIRSAIARHDLAGALKAVPLNELPKKIQTVIAGHIRDTFEGAADLAPLPAAVEPAVQFNITNPATLDYIRTMTMDTALRITNETREAVRDAIYRGFTEGIHPYDIAMELRDRIGLTTNQWKTVDNYSAFLDGLSERDSLAGLGKGPRDLLRRGGFRRGADPANLQLTPDRKESMLQNYVNRLRNERCTVIARTLVTDASNAGQNALWDQARDEGFLDERLWEKTWMAAHDERTCPICGVLHGQRRELNGNYPSGQNRPPAHPNCRCSEGLVRKSNSDGLLSIHSNVAARAAKWLEKQLGKPKEFGITVFEE